MKRDEFFKISYPYCRTCERIMHIIQRRELEGKKTCKSDIQEFLTGIRGNNGRRESITRHINELIKNKYIVISGSERDRRRKNFILNMEQLKPKFVTIEQRTLQGMLDENARYDEIDWNELDNLIECRICGMKMERKIEYKEEVAGEGVIYYEDYQFKCKNCGFTFSISKYI
jgi:hypothetical protein